MMLIEVRRHAINRNMEPICRRTFGNAHPLTASVIAGGSAVLLAAFPLGALPPTAPISLTITPLMLAQPLADPVAPVPKWNFADLFPVPPQAIVPPPGAMLIPNWEVGRNAVQVLPNYQAGMGKLVLVEERQGELAPMQAAPFSARQTLSPRSYPASPDIQPPVFGRLSSEPSAASQ